jgi:hypothetical protein
MFHLLLDIVLLLAPRDAVTYTVNKDVDIVTNDDRGGSDGNMCLSSNGQPVSSQLLITVVQISLLFAYL